MEEQYKKTFDQMVDSLKMYQRYELKDKNRKDILDKVYVDPIENDGILNLCLKDNTTVLIAQELDVSWQKIGWIAKKIEEDYCYLKKEPRKGKMYYVLSDLGREYLDSITP